MNRFDSIIDYSVADLRASEGLSYERVHINDTFQRGVYEYDPADNSAADDLGLTLVTADSRRFKRKLEYPSVHAEWFKTASNTDLGAVFNTLFALATVNEIIVSKETTLSVGVTVPLGKRIRLTNAGSLIGAGKVQGAIDDDTIYELRLSKTFAGTTNHGEVGSVTLASVSVPSGYFIEEALIDVDSGLTAGAGAYITLGIATDDTECVLDAIEGLVDTLNANVITKVYPSFVKATADRAVVMSVAVDDVTAGTIDIILRIRKF